MRALCWLLPLALALGCIGPEDNPSQVHDLRVLGVQLDPPELMYTPSNGSCATSPADPAFDPSDLLVFLSPVQFRALIADPAGAGRDLQYRLFACADVEDRACEEERVLLAEGVTPEGELALELRPALAQLDDETPLLERLIENDEFFGALGLWLPLMLELRAGEEEIRAQKLLVLSCAWFPGSEANENPALPGIRLGGAPLDEAAELRGAGPFELAPDDFTALQVPYVLPSIAASPEPVALVESWKVAWYTDTGVFSPNQTGGTDLGGESARHNVEWIPPLDATAGEVRFWFVVRDGRGGLSWITRTARYVP